VYAWPQDVEPEVLTAFVAGFNLRDLDAKIMAAQRGNNNGQVVLAPGAVTLRRTGVCKGEGVLGGENIVLWVCRCDIAQQLQF
jgi:hypothetical protein